MVVVVLQGCHRRGRRLRRCRRRRGRFRCLTDVVAIAATVGVIVVVIVVVGVVGTGGTHHRTGDALVPAAESTAPPPSATPPASVVRSGSGSPRGIRWGRMVVGGGKPPQGVPRPERRELPGMCPGES